MFLAFKTNLGGGGNRMRGHSSALDRRSTTLQRCFALVGLHRMAVVGADCSNVAVAHLGGPNGWAQNLRALPPIDGKACVVAL